MEFTRSYLLTGLSDDDIMAEYDAQIAATHRRLIEDRVRILTMAFLAPEPVWKYDPIKYEAPHQFNALNTASLAATERAQASTPTAG